MEKNWRKEEKRGNVFNNASDTFLINFLNRSETTYSCYVMKIVSFSFWGG